MILLEIVTMLQNVTVEWCLLAFLIFDVFFSHIIWSICPVRKLGFEERGLPSISSRQTDGLWQPELDMPVMGDQLSDTV